MYIFARIGSKFVYMDEVEKGTTFGNGLSIERVSDRVSECVCM